MDTHTHLTSSRNFRQALVIGGGIAGLLAARVLADHFASVVVLERGRRPEGPAFRRETPQAYHRHGLSLEGKRIFEQLFPGLDQALAQANCPRVAAPQPGDAHGADYVLLRARETAVSSPTTLGDRIVSRPRLEWEVFRRVAQLPNVRFAWERRVTALLPGPDAAFVGGVAAHDHATGAPETLPADLVVDASGRFSKILSWLAAAGYDAPEESAFDSQLLMVTQWFDVPAGDPLPWEGLMIEPRHPHNFRSAMITRIEGQHLLLTLSGKAGFNPPTNAAALMDYLRQLRKPGIYDVLRRAAPAGPPKGFAHTGNRRRHWERVDRFPNNLIVVGDAAHTFNPGHAFGMGLAAQCAEALQQLLAQGGSRHSLAGFSRAYHQAAAAVIEPTWQFVLQSDRYDLENVWTDRLRADLTQPLTPEPHVAAWQGYAQRAAQEGALPTLQPRLVQLQFPVQEGISRTAAYRQAARQGIVPQQPALPGLQLQAPAALRLHVHASAFGPVPLLLTPHRADFELLVQAFAKRNEPQPLPAATTAYLISGLNNWDRVRALKQDWLRQLQPPPASPQAIAMLWQQAFKRLLPQKALYQDRFMLVHARLAAVPAADLGLPAAEWQRLAPLIEAEHAATIYTLPRLLGYLRDDPLHTELLAYAIGILRAAGQFHADWFLRFVDDALLQDERPPDLAVAIGQLAVRAAGGRDAAWLARIAANVARFTAQAAPQPPGPRGCLRLLLALDSLTLADLAQPDAVAQLHAAVARLRQGTAAQAPAAHTAVLAAD